MSTSINPNVYTAQENGEVTVYASPHRDVVLLKDYAFNQSTRVIHVHLTGRHTSSDEQMELQLHRDKLSKESFDQMLEQMYLSGGSPEIMYTTLELAYERGLIGVWEYRWRKLVRTFRRWVGRLKANANSGARSAPPDGGTGPTASA